MKLILLTFLLTSMKAFSCEIKFPHQIIVISENHPSSLLSFLNCNEQLQADTAQIINEVEGKLPSYQFSELLKQKGHSNISIHPNFINIAHLKTIIRNKIELPHGVQIKSVRPINSESLLSLAPGDNIEINCSDCLYGEGQTLKIIIEGFDGSIKTIPAKIDFKKMVRAYRINSDIPSFTTLDSSLFLKEEFIESIPHTDLVSDSDALKFYKTNKPLKAGQLLRFADLNAVNLVKAGLKTDVVLENTMIRIKTQGISRSNGSIGEVVEVFHPQKNKKYQGKVIDLNKVLVEL